MSYRFHDHVVHRHLYQLYVLCHLFFHIVRISQKRVDMLVILLSKEIRCILQDKPKHILSLDLIDSNLQIFYLCLTFESFPKFIHSLFECIDVSFPGRVFRC